MTHTKIIIRIFMLIGVFDVFAFGQQNRLFQNIFDITNNPVGVEILDSAPNYQTMEITEDIAYQELLRLISSFEKQADKQLNEGYAQRANFLRSFLQRKAGLTLEQANILKADALNFITRFGCRTNSDTVINQNENFDSEKLDRERNQILKQYRNRFRQLLGESVNKFDRFVQEKIASRLIYTKDLETRNAYFGFSMVDYDYQSNEVIGYSYTEEPPGHCEIIENIVLATLSSDKQGVVDYDSAEMCDGRAEVYLYYSNPQPEDRFCVDGEHYFVRVFGLPFNDSRRKSNRVLCPSGKIEALPSSEDCLTTPPLPNVTSVSFDLIEMGNTGIDTNPNVGGGQRIFPDKDTPNDTVNRQQIKVTARLGENRAGVRVYFGNFDLDDPSDDTTIDPNGIDGGDNNGDVNGNTAGHLSATFAETNGNGEASVTFTVTRQPGDNFAIAAGVDSDAVSEVTVSGIDLTRNGTSIETNCDGTDLVCRTPMLTVWRRLHIEVDSMGDVQQNLVSGIIPDEIRVRRNTSTTITLEPLNNEPMEVNRFENGRLALGSSSLEVTSNTETTVTVFNNNQPTVYASANSLFHLYDDDDFNDNDGTNLRGDIDEDVTEPSRNLLTEGSDDSNTNVLAPIYIRPVYDVVDNTDNSYFLANAIGDFPSDTQQLFVDRDLITTNIDVEFWTVYVLGSYQHTPIEDNDPAIEAQTFGIADGIPHFLGDGSGVLIHLEAHNSREILQYPAPISLRNTFTTVAHEIGHLLSGRHGDGGIMTDSFGQITSAQFSPTTVRRIRTLLTHP